MEGFMRSEKYRPDLEKKISFKFISTTLIFGGNSSSSDFGLTYNAIKKVSKRLVNSESKLKTSKKYFDH